MCLVSPSPRRVYREKPNDKPRIRYRCASSPIRNARLFLRDVHALSPSAPWPSDDPKVPETCAHGLATQVSGTGNVCLLASG